MNINIERLKHLATAADKGPWAISEYDGGIEQDIWTDDDENEECTWTGVHIFLDIPPEEIAPRDPESCAYTSLRAGLKIVATKESNLAFMAAADPSTILALISEIERLNGEIAVK